MGDAGEMVLSQRKGNNMKAEGSKEDIISSGSLSHQLRTPDCRQRASLQTKRSWLGGWDC